MSAENTPTPINAWRNCCRARPSDDLASSLPKRTLGEFLLLIVSIRVNRDAPISGTSLTRREQTQDLCQYFLCQLGAVGNRNERKRSVGWAAHCVKALAQSSRYSEHGGDGLELAEIGDRRVEQRGTRAPRLVARAKHARSCGAELRLCAKAVRSFCLSLLPNCASSSPPSALASSVS